MEVTMSFKLPDDDYEYRHAVKGYAYYMALTDIAEDIFRPARKHGYPDKSIQDLLDELGDKGYDLIDILEQQFYEILSEQGVNLTNG